MSLPPPYAVPPAPAFRKTMERHRIISFIKSAVRIGASFLFIAFHFTADAVTLIIAEIGGIAEEVYGS